MQIILASSEAVPFSKTGGLADVAAALMKSLAAAGHTVCLMLPYHRQAISETVAKSAGIETTGCFIDVPVGEKTVSAEIFRAAFPQEQSPQEKSVQNKSAANENITIFLIDQPDYFDRAGLYQQDGESFEDNSERYLFFSRAIFETARAFDLQPDVIHANDWQTGVVPALLAVEYREQPRFAQTASVFTIHNMAFQGQFWHWDMQLTGLDWKYFNWQQMEFFGHLNLLKTGVVFAEMVTTVSPTYADEIQTAEFGAGLQGVLRDHNDKLVGILNGIDTDIWNPATDAALPTCYSVDQFSEGKSACKAALQKEMKLPQRADFPLFGMISRMTDQKGFDLILEAAESLLSLDLQFCFLGTGDGDVEQALVELSQRYPSKIAVTVGFDDALAHRIEAGSDAFLMPSRFEPCGLNQLYSMRYGTLPVVRAVGGLADSVVGATDENLSKKTANGFSFSEYNSDAFAAQVCHAVDLFQEKEVWQQLVETGMRHDWSWAGSAERYLEVYQQARQRVL